MTGTCLPQLQPVTRKAGIIVLVNFVVTADEHPAFSPKSHQTTVLARLKIGGCATTVTYCLSQRARHPRSSRPVLPILPTKVVNTANWRRSTPKLSNLQFNRVAHPVTGPPPVLCLLGFTSSKARRRQCPVRGRRRATHKRPPTSICSYQKQCLPNRLLPSRAIRKPTRKSPADLDLVQQRAREAEATDHSRRKTEDQTGSGRQGRGEVCLPRMLDREARNRRLCLEI
jgi:hypothetical protein